MEACYTDHDRYDRLPGAEHRHPDRHRARARSRRQARAAIPTRSSRTPHSGNTFTIERKADRTAEASCTDTGARRAAAAVEARGD